MDKIEEANGIEKTISDLFYGRSLNGPDRCIMNLGIGTPDPELLMNCCEIFNKATCFQLKTEAHGQGEIFRYGPLSGPLGLRQRIAEYFTQAYKSKVSVDNIFITSGATQGLQLTLSTLLDLKGYVFVDEVTYMFALDIIKDVYTINMVKVKLLTDGVDIDDLRRVLKRTHFTSTTKRFWGLYYTMPVLHNPTGITFSDEVCKQLIKVAREFDILVFCDDIYNIFFDNKDRAAKRLFEYDDSAQNDFKGSVISNCSFSKILSPGIRLGWMEAPTTCRLLLEKSGVIQSSGCLNNYTAGIMCSLFELGLFQENTKYMRRVCQERMFAATRLLKENLPKSCSLIDPHGGYFIWIQMPERTDSYEFLKLCLPKYKVFFICGVHFSVDEDKYRNYFRISILAEKKILKVACLQICKALHEYLKSL